MLGLIDGTRAARMMENLLAEIRRKGARFAILDLTGVEDVDIGTAGHLLKLVDAIRLLGAQGIVTGIPSRVAKTLIMLGVDLARIATLTTLRDGLQFCITRMRASTA
jgi:rsbT co-antagonist protein RsbR